MRSEASRAAALAGAILAGSFLVASLLGWWTLASAVLAIAVLAAAAYPILVRFRVHQFDLLEPIVGGAVALGIIFGIRPLAMLLVGNLSLRDQDTTPEFQFVVALGLVGTVAFVGVYEWVRARQATSATDEPARAMHPRIAYGYIVVLTILSVALFVVHLSRLGTDLADGIRLMTAGATPELAAQWGETTEYLSAAPILAACAATLLGVTARWRLTPLQIVVVIALIAYPTIVFYLSGDRRYVLPSIGIPILAWLLMTGIRPNRRFMLTVVPVAFLVFATIPFIRWAEARDKSGGVAAAFVEGIGNPVRAIDRFVLGPDTGMFSALALEVRALRTPQDYFYGRATVGDLLLAPIPHIVFAAKPQTARNEMLIKVFGAPCGTSVNGICDDFSIIGTFYQDFWVPGVAILMGLVGAASAALWGRWRRSPLDARLVVVTATWVVFVPIIFRAGFMPAFQWCLYFLVPCLVGAVLATIQVGRQRTAAEQPVGSGR